MTSFSSLPPPHRVSVFVTSASDRLLALVLIKFEMASTSTSVEDSFPKTKLFRCGMCSQDFPSLLTCVTHMKTHSTGGRAPTGTNAVQAKTAAAAPVSLPGSAVSMATASTSTGPSVESTTNSDSSTTASSASAVNPNLLSQNGSNEQDMSATQNTNAGVLLETSGNVAGSLLVKDLAETCASEHTKPATPDGSGMAQSPRKETAVEQEREGNGAAAVQTREGSAETVTQVDEQDKAVPVLTDKASGGPQSMIVKCDERNGEVTGTTDSSTSEAPNIAAGGDNKGEVTCHSSSDKGQTTSQGESAGSTDNKSMDSSVGAVTESKGTVKSLLVACNEDMCHMIPSSINTGNTEDEGKTKQTSDPDRPHVCTVCDARFRHMSSLSTHKRRHTGMEPYSCSECNKKFWDPSNLRVHMRTHTSDRPYVCDICGHRSNQANDIKTHRRIHTGEMPYMCTAEGCSKTFRDASHFRRHMKKHAGVKPHIPCDLCSAMFFNRSGLARHRRKHTGEKDYHCDIYRSQCRRHIKKANHRNTTINVVTKQDPPDPDMLIKQEPVDVDPSSKGTSTMEMPKKSTVLQVPLAITKGDGTSEGNTTYETIEIELPDTGFTDDADAEEITYQYGEMLITISRSTVSQLQEAKSDSLPGENASDLVEDVSDLVEDISDFVENAPDSAEDASDLAESQSNSEENAPKSGEWFTCPHCAVIFSTDTQLQEHAKTHAAKGGNRPSAGVAVNVTKASMGGSDASGGRTEKHILILDQAQANSPSVAQDSLGQDRTARAHPLSEHNDFGADLIDHEYPLSAGTVVHVKRQRTPRTGERRFLCATCNAAFFHMAELRRHALKHTGEKPYQCKFCGKRVRDPSNLKRHIRTHTGERPYRCRLCDRRFAQAGHLTSHVRIHTGERPYVCTKCDARFVESNHLRHHLKVHAGIKPFKCDQCDLAFIRAAELKRHKLIHTGNKTCKCPDCPATFFRPDALKQHMMKHVKSPSSARHNCRLCPQSFSYPGFLHRHMVNVHKIENTHQKTEKPDAENSVVADALCELATGRRASAAASETENEAQPRRTVAVSSSDASVQVAFAAMEESVVEAENVSATESTLTEETVSDEFEQNNSSDVRASENIEVDIDKIASGSVVLSDTLTDGTSFVVVSNPREATQQLVSILNPPLSNQATPAVSSSNISIAAMEVCTTADTPVTVSPVLSADHQYVDQSVIGQVNTQNAQLVIGNEASLELTMESLLSGQAHLESVHAVEVREEDTQAKVGQCGEVIIKQEMPDAVEQIAPVVTPLRTRSGRERKIKVKFSM
ncbi:hypothetical protein BaRGS_00025158 [Batillaria attramentaria]|uniref:C2H2-type domain-containing protein n=1 Tax=Batillaria attramentaria TaxID=370345 RepID=A0ABD0K991_9CAEN